MSDSMTLLYDIIIYLLFIINLLKKRKKRKKRKKGIMEWDLK